MENLDARLIDRLNLLLGGAAILVAALLAPRPVAVGVALGAALSAANFHAMHRLLWGGLHAEGRRRALLHTLLGLKLGVLAALVYVALRFAPMSAPAFAAGLSLFLISVMVATVICAVGAKADDGRA